MTYWPVASYRKEKSWGRSNEEKVAKGKEATR
jgi:hypothetical protein